MMKKTGEGESRHMATGTGVGATVLTALKAHLAAVAIGATVVVGGGAAAAAVATGAIHSPAQASSTAHADKTPDAQATHGAQGETARANACANNDDAKHMASVYANMFRPASGSGKSAEQTAQADICAFFAGSDGHAVGFGEIRQALDIAAAIEMNMASKHSDTATASACLAADPATGNSADAGNSATSGQPSFTAPTADEATTLGILKSVFDKMSHGTPLAQLARACGVPAAPGTAGSGGSSSGDNGGAHGKPTGTPGARPTGTPGSGHP